MIGDGHGLGCGWTWTTAVYRLEMMEVCVSHSQILIGNGCFLILLMLLLIFLQLLLLFLMLLHDLAHPTLHEFLLQLPHAHIGLDGGEFALFQLGAELVDLWGEVGLGGELIAHMGEHLELNDALLFGRGLHHLGHVTHHMGLHLDRHALLQLELVQMLLPCLLQHL